MVRHVVDGWDVERRMECQAVGEDGIYIHEQNLYYGNDTCNNQQPQIAHAWINRECFHFLFIAMVSTIITAVMIQEGMERMSTHLAETKEMGKEKKQRRWLKRAGRH